MDFDLVWGVFTEDFKVKNCGRDKCIKLITHLSSLYPDIDFGDTNTGFLNIEVIRKIVEEV